MASSDYTYVAYFIPYDGDSEDHPNLFLVKKPVKSIKLADVKQAFPLPGTYFFRAKQTYGKTYVWLDVDEDTQKVPTYEGKIHLKVSRLSFQENARPSAPRSMTAAQASRASASSADRAAPPPRANASSRATTDGNARSSRPAAVSAAPPPAAPGPPASAPASATPSAARGGGGDRTGGSAAGAGGGADAGGGDLLGLGEDDGPSVAAPSFGDSDPFAAHDVPPPRSGGSTPTATPSPAAAIAAAAAAAAAGGPRGTPAAMPMGAGLPHQQSWHAGQFAAMGGHPRPGMASPGHGHPPRGMGPGMMGSSMRMGGWEASNGGR